ncbi:unnamed protein product [Rotaria magnacalcarata]|uniref:Nuclear receptor domain-containing protein n=3 Tax=Rotaria magnacalcarata TaxID=392030 RepID=A0A816LFY1_9BILA|nr:unnamed protein product [Rotaria magnacalcarata]CAF2114425.1 unnamed protein product [Rotaria magnacalcarata]CAF3784823.1 unnamed protein product [Rotaria magnacalcarata]
MYEQLNENKRCQVCGDTAYISNYGALSCASCKSFFRRRGFHPENIPKCAFYENCHITVQSRKSCSACRFTKCLAVGMHTYRIRKEEIIIRKRSSKGIRTPLNLLSKDVSSLCPENWVLLSNVIHAFDSFSPLSKVQSTIEFLTNVSLDVQYSVQQAQNMFSSICQSLQLTVSSTADFRIMTTDEQFSLLKRNMGGVWTFYSMVICHQCNFLDSATSKSIMVPLYGFHSVERVRLISLRLDPDITLVKLILMILSFSSNCFAVKNDQINKRDSLLMGTFRLFGSQNVYVEIMWQYMLYRYGYFESAKRFLALIKIMLDEIELGSKIYENNQVHQDLANEIVQETAQSWITNNSESVPLWGKNCNGTQNYIDSSACH